MADKVPIDAKQLSMNTMRILFRMRKEKKYCDFLIKVGSLEIPAHRNILGANSEFFDKMLSHPTVENKSGVVEMKDVDPECASICINHMYGEEVSVPHGKYEPMMFVVTMMQLHMLRRAILTLLEENMDSKSFYVAMRIANMYECKKLEEKCVKFAEENFGSISREKEFINLEKSYIKKMVKEKNVNMSEEEKLKAVLNWIGCNSERKKFLVEMIKWVELSKVTVDYRRHLIEEDDQVYESRECMRLLSTSVMDSLQSGASQDVQSEKRIMIFDEISGHLQLWNPKVNTWKKMQEMNDDMKVTCFSAVALGNHIYVLMKNRSVCRLEYLKETGKWERMADMIEDHGSCPLATVISNCLYVVGGHNDKSTSTVEKYNPVENKWTKVGERGKPSQWAEVLSCEGFIYTFGGWIDGEFSDKVERFEPIPSKWTELASMKEAKGYVAATHLHGNIYVLGGFKSGTHYNSLEVYDIKNNNWTSLKPMNVSRSWFRTFAIDGHIYAVGGFNSSADSIEKYDLDKRQWEMVEIPSVMELNIEESCEVILH